MAHFAKLGVNSKVIAVHGLDNDQMLNADGKEDESVGQNRLQQIHGWPAQMWIQTSYNTQAKKYKEQDGTLDADKQFRGNYAGIGYTYDETNDVFYAPKPYESWSISESTNWLWKCPVDYPIDNNQNNPDTSLPKKFYKWNEENQEWDLSYTVTYNTETKEWIVDE